MKKFFALLLALAMVLSLAACGGSAEEKKDEPDGPSSAPSSATDDIQPVEPQESDDVVDTSVFTMGEISGKTYENPFFNIAFELPDSDWTFATDEEIAEVAGVTVDMLGEDYEEILEDAQSIFAMMAKATMGNNANIGMEKLPEGYEDLTAEQYAEISAQNASTMLSQAGATNLQTESTVCFIDGQEFPGQKITYELSGIDVSQKLFAICRDGYVCCATVTAMGEDATDDILSSFRLMY